MSLLYRRPSTLHSNYFSTSWCSDASLSTSAWTARVLQFARDRSLTGRLYVSTYVLYILHNTHVLDRLWLATTGTAFRSLPLVIWILLGPLSTPQWQWASPGTGGLRGQQVEEAWPLETKMSLLKKIKHKQVYKAIWNWGKVGMAVIKSNRWQKLLQG